MNAIEKRTFQTVIAAQGDEPTIVISTDAVDRDDDVLDPAGCDFANYTRNPVVLFGHDSRDLPVGASTSVSVERSGIKARWRWLRGDARADRVRNAFDQGVLRAASVGFRPLAHEPRAGGRGVTFTKWELLEWSLVPIPANPEAVRVLRSLGLRDDEPVLELLDDGDETIDFDPYDLREAIRSVLPNLVRDTARRMTREALDHARGRVSDSMGFDADVLRVRRASASRDTFDVEPSDVRAALAELAPELRRTIRESVALALRQARGRLD